MTITPHKIQVLSGPEQRRRWGTAEKLAFIQETYEPDATVSILARRHGIQSRWRNQPVIVIWPAAGFVDTEIRCLTELESWNAEKEVQPRVQA